MTAHSCATRQHLREMLGIEFTAPQMDAITAGLDPPSAIIAGAGSGKTTVMAARVVWLVGHQGIAPERILGLTFTNKAAAELGQRIRASIDLLGVDHELLGWGDPTASTYHAFAGSLIAEHGLRLGIEPDLRVVTDATRFQRAARAIESYAGPLAHRHNLCPDADRPGDGPRRRAVRAPGGHRRPSRLRPRRSSPATTRPPSSSPSYEMQLPRPGPART